MNAKELAALLNGRNYGDEITKEEAAQAKAAGLVVVYGASDDLMEFEGAIHDEVGCCDGGSALVDTKGLLPNYDNLDVGDKSELRNYFLREDAAVVVEALWDTGGYSWMYQTAIPHETFEIVEDGEPYCRGIVFALADAKPAEAA